MPRPPKSTPFPYTTLFRSQTRHRRGRGPCVAENQQGRTCELHLPHHAVAGPANLQIDRVQLESRESAGEGDRKSTHLNSSHVASSYAVFCLKKKKKKKKTQ